MNSKTCRGLPGNWINAWLAAVGATVLDPRIRLHWTKGGTPVAVLSTDAVDPVAALVESWPDRSVLDDLPLARDWRNTAGLPRNVPADSFRHRARAARNHRSPWALSSTLTDLHVNERTGEVAHAPFDPPAPRGATLHDRLLRVHAKVEPSTESLMASLAGHGVREQGNGLGFDVSRLGSLADASSPSVDPVIETLAFFGLALLPVRGTGRDRPGIGFGGGGPVQRGWVRFEEQGRRFVWPAWSQRLDCTAIDALMDAWIHDRKSTWQLLEVHAGWRVIPYEPRDKRNDVTRAFASEPL